jgi:hypothetical protein
MEENGTKALIKLLRITTQIPVLTEPREDAKIELGAL